MDHLAPKLPIPLPPHTVAAGGGAPLVAREQRDLLCALAYVALGVGDEAQAVALLELVVREAPDDCGALQLLAYARVAAGDGERALTALARIAACSDRAPSAPLLLLRSQAQRLTGQIDAGRTSFRAFVEARNTAEVPR